MREEMPHHLSRSIENRRHLIQCYVVTVHQIIGEERWVGSISRTRAYQPGKRILELPHVALRAPLWTDPCDSPEEAHDAVLRYLTEKYRELWDLVLHDVIADLYQRRLELGVAEAPEELDET